MTGGAGAVFWMVVSVILFVVEGATTQLICLWFAFGALFAVLASFIGAPLWVQLLIFLVSSVAVLIVGRPIFMEKLSKRREPTNADRVIGQTGLVIEQIDNLAQTGRVSVNGLDWTARTEEDTIVPVRSKVLVLRIDGVKLIVGPAPEPAWPQDPEPEDTVEAAAVAHHDE